MKHKYTLFNIACLFVSMLFALGILWLWRGSFVNLDAQDIPEAITLNKILSADDSKINGLENILPAEKIVKKEINLAVPFTSQAPEENWDEPWQDACEEAAALMLDAYYKNYNLSPLFVRDEIIKMVKWEETRGWGTSIEIAKIKELFDTYLLEKNKAKIIENPTIEQIKNYISQGRPVLAVADGKVLPNPHFRNGGPVYHALIIRGFTGDSFITNDPGTKFGKNFLYKYNDLLKSIHDWNNGDVKNGRSAILVIE